jgi:hypothetical protein
MNDGALPFDRVVLTEGGKRTVLRTQEFLAIPLPRKIQYILARTVEFYSGNVPVERRVALSSLRELRSV